MIRLGAIGFGEEERKAIMDLISVDDPQLVMGKYVYEFERKFAQWIGKKHGIAVNSGTSALILSLAAVKEKYQFDDVFTTSLTYPATWNACLVNQMSLHCQDIESKSLNMDLKLLPTFEGVLLPVHLFGKPVHGLEMRGECIIEDATHALGSKIGDEKMGSIGLLGCFSFFPAHQFSTIEGGMIVTDDDDLAEICKCLRDNGRICTCPVCTLRTVGVCQKRSEYQGELRWATDYVGYNMKMTEIQGVLGVVKMGKIDRIVERRHHVLHMYNEELDDVGCLKEEETEYICPLAYPLMVKDARKVVYELSKAGIESRGMFPFRGNSPKAEYVSKHGVFVPCHHLLDDEQVKYIIQTLKRIKGL